jgi:hypothetical protein
MGIDLLRSRDLSLEWSLLEAPSMLEGITWLARDEGPQLLLIMLGNIGIEFLTVMRC